MTVVTAEDDRYTPADGEWTVDDLAYLPDDGNRYELVDGHLVVSPAPANVHQWAVAALYRALYERCPPHLRVNLAPMDFQPHRKSSFQPDLLVTRRADEVPRRTLTAAPVIAVEVVSPGSRKLDHGRKKDAYRRHGVAHYWIFDPDRPELLAFTLTDGEYHLVASATGDERIVVERPYPVEICPAVIVEG